MKVFARIFLEQVRHLLHCVWLRILLQLTVFGLAIVSPCLWVGHHTRLPEN
jgi:hypothetical protein